MTMTNDENAAPLSVNVNISPVLVKSTDAISDPKSSLRRGTKRTRDAIEEKRVEEEAKPCAPVSKRAKIEAWWRDATSTLGNVRSSVAESMVAKRAAAKMTQVGGALRKLPTWIQSGGTVATAFIKAAVSQASKGIEAPVAIASNSQSPQLVQSLVDSSSSLGSSALLEHVITPCVDPPISQVVAQSPEEVFATAAAADATSDPAELQSELSKVVEPMVTPTDGHTTDGLVVRDDVQISPKTLRSAAVTPITSSKACARPYTPGSPVRCTPQEEEATVLDEEALKVAISDEIIDFEQDVEEDGMHQAETMPALDAFDYDPAFANEANQVAADELDYIVDTQGVEWFPVHDDTTGFVYYWNQRTGETSWNRPVTSAEAAFGA